MSEIRFYLKTGDYGWLSNFAPYPIELDGQRWPTSEHYYQAQKSPSDAEWMEEIRHHERPYDAWRMGRNAEHPRRPDWDAVKDEVMRAAVRAKFVQHEELRRLLLATGDAQIVEHSPIDNYWGDGGDGSGKNALGHILMEIRDELRADAQHTE